MPVKVREEGNYELFETTNRNEILVLNGEKWYALVEGQAGDIIVLSDSDHEKRKTLRKGPFYLVDFDEDPKFKDMTHLFLGTDGSYEEAVLPQDLPTRRDKQKKLVRTDAGMTKRELEEYLEHPAPAGPGEERMRRPGGGSLANVTYHLKGIDLPATRSEVVDYAKKKRAPKAVIEQLEGMRSRRYKTMADITRAIGESKEPLPIEDYDDLSASEIANRIEELTPRELRVIRERENATLQRKTILQRIDRKLELGRKKLPIEGYEDMTASQIADHLDELSKSELRRLKEYEEKTRGRKTVLEAIERKDAS